MPSLRATTRYVNMIKINWADMEDYVYALWIRMSVRCGTMALVMRCILYIPRRGHNFQKSDL
jgi:hypothetical protein